MSNQDAVNVDPPKVGDVYEDPRTGFRYTILRQHMPEVQYHQGWWVSREPAYMGREKESRLDHNKFSKWVKVFNGNG